MFTQGFSGTVHDGETIRCEVEGFQVVAKIWSDDDATAPWDREDGHGPVSDWRSAENWHDGARPMKAPGELVLHTDGYGARASFRLYDFAEACRIARRDGWGVEGGKRDGETARQYASRAALADFERLRKWCNDDWQYVGVSVTVSRNGIKVVDDFEHALWGVESDAAEYLTETANELLPAALESARENIAALCA